MRQKADPDDGFLKVADALAQALARAALNGNEYAICWWVMCRTYGVRQAVRGKVVARKFTTYSAKFIARATGRDYRGITRSLYDLVGARRNILTTKSGGQEIGFNTRIGDWAAGLIRGQNEAWGAEVPAAQRGRLSPLRAAEKGTPVPLKGDACPLKRGRLSPLGTVARDSARDEKSNQRVESERTASAGLARGARVSQPEYRAETPVQKVVCAYKVAKGLAWNDRGWDHSNYGRAAAAAKEVLRAFDAQVKPAAEFVVAFGERMDKAGRSWTLETAAKWAWDTKGERGARPQAQGGVEVR